MSKVIMNTLESKESASTMRSSYLWESDITLEYTRASVRKNVS